MVFAITSTACASLAPATARARASRTRRSSVIRRADADEESATATADATTTTNAASASDETRELRDGELDIKKGLFATFIKPGEKEVSAEKFREFQAEIAAKKAEAKRRQEEARKNKKGPFGLW
jgi:hypothetical protein